MTTITKAGIEQAGYTTNFAPLGRLLPPCTDGSAHHFAASRRTPTYVSSSNPNRVVGARFRLVRHLLFSRFPAGRRQ